MHIHKLSNIINCATLALLPTIFIANNTNAANRATVKDRKPYNKIHTNDGTAINKYRLFLETRNLLTDRKRHNDAIACPVNLKRCCSSIVATASDAPSDMNRGIYGLKNCHK